MSLYRVGSNKSSINNFPNVRPSLDLDFANTKTLDPRITFTRSSGGSYVGADGLIKYAGVNEARFDHDPVTGESLGLLVEEARTNIITRSISTGWVAGTTSSGGALPTGWGIDQGQPGTQLQIVGGGIENGINYVDLRFFGTNTSSMRWLIRPGNSVTLTAGVTYTSSVYAKLISGSISGSIGAITCQFSVFGGPFGAPLTGTKTNRLTRYFGVFTATSTGTYFPRLDVGSQVIGNTYDFTIRIAGFQVEVGAFPTSYIPTTTSAVTRAADVAQITGTNFSSWYRQDEGTMYAFFKGGRESNQFGYGRVVGVDGTFSMLSTNGSTDSLSVFFGVPALALNLINNVDYWNVGNSAVVAYNSSSTIVTKANQSSSFSRTPNINGNITGWGLGSRLGSSTNMLNGTIKRLTYWPKRLPDAQLQALTR